MLAGFVDPRVVRLAQEARLSELYSRSDMNHRHREYSTQLTECIFRSAAKTGALGLRKKTRLCRPAANPSPDERINSKLCAMARGITFSRALASNRGAALLVPSSHPTTLHRSRERAAQGFEGVSSLARSCPIGVTTDSSSRAPWYRTWYRPHRIQRYLNGLNGTANPTFVLR